MQSISSPQRGRGWRTPLCVEAGSPHLLARLLQGGLGRGCASPCKSASFRDRYKTNGLPGGPACLSVCGWQAGLRHLSGCLDPPSVCGSGVSSGVSSRARGQEGREESVATDGPGDRRQVVWCQGDIPSFSLRRPPLLPPFLTLSTPHPGSLQDGTGTEPNPRDSC